MSYDYIVALLFNLLVDINRHAGFIKMIKYKTVFSIILVPWVIMLTTSTSYSAVTLAGTRFVYNASESSLEIGMTNRDKNPYLVQSWVSKYTPPGTKDLNKDNDNIPFIVTPPLFKMEPNDSNTLSIVKRDDITLPNDRESVFYLNVKAIPGKVKDSRSSLMISVASSMKLLYRPINLEGENAINAWEKVNFQQVGKFLVANNPTPYYITFYEIDVNGTKTKLPQNAMIAPFGKWTLPVEGKVHSLKWQTLGDDSEISLGKTVTL